MCCSRMFHLWIPCQFDLQKISDDTYIARYYRAALQVWLDTWAEVLETLSWTHVRNYTNPTQQRQMLVIYSLNFLNFLTNVVLLSLRIIYMPPIYAIISFFSYRFFRAYTYYSFIQAGMLCSIITANPISPKKQNDS